MIWPEDEDERELLAAWLAAAEQEDEAAGVVDVVPDHVMPDVSWMPTRPLACSGCGVEVQVPTYRHAMVQAQVRLWRRGWRRVPETGRDYCPPCVPRSAG